MNTGLQAYIPPETYGSMRDNAKDMWERGLVAKLLVATGVAVVRQETIPTICYRMNMLNQSEVQEKVATGMPVDEVHIPDIITPELLQPFVNATVHGGVFKALNDEEFITKLVAGLEALPRVNIFEVAVMQKELLDRADAERSEGE